MTDPIIDIEALERVHAQSDARLAEVLAGWDKTWELMGKTTGVTDQARSDDRPFQQVSGGRAQ
jgi:hypothetical protein